MNIASIGNATDFGNLTVARNSSYGSSSNGVRGIWCSGVGPPGNTVKNVIDYVTIASLGDASDFGDLSGASYNTSSCANDTRACIGKGLAGASRLNVIEYIQFDSPANSNDFGDLTVARDICGALSGT